MPIRYFIDLDCKPRQNLGSDVILSMVSRYERAETIKVQYQEKYKVTDENLMRFRETVNTPTGESEKKERTVAELKESCSPLWDHSRHCEGCPAALLPSAYSCIQPLSFPVSEKAENWLMKQLAPTGTRAVELFLDACSRSGYGDIPQLENWRKAGILESKEPVKEERSGILVTSNQILNELFFVGDIMPNHALGILIHLQLMISSEGDTGDDLLDILEGVDQSGSTENAPTIDFRLKPKKSDDECIREFKQFFLALFRAFSLQIPLAIRL